MKKTILLLFLIAKICNAQMQIDISLNKDLNKLVKEYFIGSGLTIKSVSINSEFSYYPLIGGFTNGKSKVGMDKGLVLATGDVTKIVKKGTSCSSLMSYGNNSIKLGSSELYKYSDKAEVDAGGDASILKITFIPNTDVLIFNYVFASEEYPEYVGSKFNDIFVFLLSGKGIVGKKNIALIPNTNLNVSINNVNNGKNGCGISETSVSPSFPNYYVDNTNQFDFVFDGQTTELVSVLDNLEIGAEYTIEIIIQDIGDLLFDSGLFLKAGSFQSIQKKYILDYSKEVCENETIHILCDSSLTNIKWTGPNNFISSSSEIFINNAQKSLEGVYYLTAKNKNSTIKDSCKITVLSLPSIQISAPDSICIGDSFNAIAKGAVNYKWYLNTLEPFNLLSNLPTLNYKPSLTQKYIAVGNDGKCENYDTVTVKVNSLPTIDISSWQYGVCPNSLEKYKTLDSLNYRYDWAIEGGKIDSVSQNGQILNGGLNAKDAYNIRIKWGAGPTGKIILKVTNKNSLCSNQFTIDVPVNGEMNPNLYGNGNPTKDSIGVCIGNSIILEARGSVGEYKWFKLNNGNPTLLGTSSTFQPLSNGTYLSTVTDNNSGCFGKDSIVVSFYPLPIANSGTYLPICEGTPINLIGSGGDSYQWLDMNMNVISNNKTHLLNLPSGEYKFILRATTFRGCTDLDTTSILIHPLPVLNSLLSVYSVCENRSLTIIMDSNYKYMWYDNNSNTISSSNTFSLFLKNSSSFTVIATNEFGCTNSKVFLVNVNPKPIVDAGKDTVICKNSEITLYKNLSFKSYWIDNKGNTTPNVENSKVKLSQTTIFRLVGINEFGCSEEDTMMVVVQPLAQADAGKDSIHICIGNEAELIGKGSGTLTWKDESGKILTNSDKYKVKPNITSTYYLNVYDNIGCEDIDSCVVVVHSYPIADAGKDIKICYGESATITGNNEYLKDWNEIGGSRISSSFTSTVVAPKKTTLFEYVVTSEYGCTSKDTMMVTVIPLPQTKAPDDITICNGDIVLLTGSGADTYVWYDQLNNTISTSKTLNVAPNITQKYYVLGSSDICSTLDSVQVNVKQISDVVEVKDNFFKSTDKNVRLPIYLNSESNLLDCLNDGNEIKIQMNYTMFNPLGVEAEGYTSTFAKVLNKSSNKWEITITLPKSAKANSNKVLFNLVGDVILGNEDTTKIDISSLSWKNLISKDSMIDGRLILTNVCYENGKRLLTYVNTNQMQLSPNPANTEVSLVCNLENEVETAKIKVYDMLGNLVFEQNILTNTNKKQITSTINLSKFANGFYNITLQTDRYVITERLNVQK